MSLDLKGEAAEKAKRLVTQFYPLYGDEIFDKHLEGYPLMKLTDEYQQKLGDNSRLLTNRIILAMISRCENEERANKEGLPALV